MAQSGQKFATGGNTLSAGEYIGTNNFYPFILKTNGTEQLRVTETGNVGIGITMPADKLHVAGTARMLNANVDNLLNALSVSAQSANFATAVVTGQITAGSLVVNGNATISGTLNAQSILQNGNPIVQSQWTTNPDSSISFNGNASVSGNISSSTLTAASIQTSQLTIDTLHALSRVAVNNSLLIEKQTAKSFAEVSTADTAVALVLQRDTTGRGVGIGIMPAAGEKLSVSGNVGVSGNLRLSSLSGTGDRVLLVDADGNLKQQSQLCVGLDAFWKTDGNFVSTNCDPFIGTTTAKDLVFKTDANGTGGERMRITRIGNIGIGTIPNTLANTQKNYKVDINGDLRVLTGGLAGNGNGIVLKTEFDNTTPPGGIPEAMVGIGTEDPVRALHIVTTHFSDIPPPPPPCPTCPPALAGSHKGIRAEDFSGPATNPTRTIWDFIPTQGNLYFSKGNPLNPLTNDAKMTILSNGNVGIGTAAPGANLHISGPGDQSIQISSTLKGSETRLMSVSSNNRTETQLQFIQRFSLVEPLSGMAMMTVLDNGNTYIGVDPINVTGTHYELNVCGTIHSREVIIETTAWCDFKLKPGHKRMTAEEKLSYIFTYGHLPEMDSGLEIETNGLKLAKNMRGMMWNLEDNTMDITDLQIENEEQKQKIEKLEKESQQQKKAIAYLKKEVEQLKVKK